MKRRTKSACNNAVHDLVFSTCPSSIFYSVDIITTQKITFQWTCQEISNKLIRPHKPITVIFCVFSFRAHAWMQYWLQRLFLKNAQNGCRCAQVLLEGGVKAPLLSWSHCKYCWAREAPVPKHRNFLIIFLITYIQIYTENWTLSGTLENGTRYLIPNHRIVWVGKDL